MIHESIKVSRQQVAQIIAATFPDYNGRKIKVEIADGIGFYGLNWDEGSRSQYRSCTVSGKASGSMDAFNQVHPWINPMEGQTAEIHPGQVWVQHTIFCGKDCGLRIYMNPRDQMAFMSRIA